MGLKDNGGRKDLNNKKPFLYYYFLVLLIVMVLNALVFPSVLERFIEVPYNEFTAQLDAGNVKDVYVDSSYMEIQYTLKDQQWPVTYKTGSMVTGAELVSRLDHAGVENYQKEIPTQASPLLSFLMTWVAPILMFVIIGQIMGRMVSKKMGGGNAMTFGKSNAKIYAENETGVTFADVAGEEEAKDALKEIVDFLPQPGKVRRYRRQSAKGRLLVGPAWNR